MTDEGSLVPYVGLPETQIERLTAGFYAWERRGRGWQVWPHSVELEPPFRPFLFHDPTPAAPPVDDARKPTFLSRLLDGIESRLEGRTRMTQAVSHEPEFCEPGAERFEDRSPVVEIQLSLPPEAKVTRDAAEQFLLALSFTSRPVAFEVVGVADRITIQLACRESDRRQIAAQLAAHFPDAAVTETRRYLTEAWGDSPSDESIIIEFGLSKEFMLPLRAFKDFAVDPLIGITAALSEFEAGEIGVFQVLFQPARNPWSESVLRAVTDWEGGSFFLDAPEIVSQTRSKVSRPLFAALVRVAAKSAGPGRNWEIVRGLGGALRQFSNPAANELIPLANDGYDQFNHEDDLLTRETQRCGMILNADELVSLVHPPAPSVRAERLVRETKKTRPAPAVATGQSFVLGRNVHVGKTTAVTLSQDQRLRHTHLIGASGTGKSHLLLKFMIQDLEQGAGFAVLDPHGDLIDRILGYVPENRIEDVILLDPSDEAYPVGLNVLQAHSALEENLLASDLVAVFRRLATSWGDQMTSVLGNAVLAFLESEEGGTLADLRRFLVDKEFRHRFLGTVRDPEVVFYWDKEFPLLTGRPQAPILTRLDAFLRPKPIRHMVAQRESRLDFARIMNEGKIFLAKLAHGAIGAENAYLLGSLLVSKFHQLALARQDVAEAERRPFWLYVDEFHHFATPSMAGVLSGARKFGLGLALAHQSLDQIAGRDQELLSAVLTNPCTRICFRVGDLDAKKLAEGFAHFVPQDLMNLGTGDALCRIERAEYDFSLRTLTLPDLDREAARRRREQIVEHSRAAYATPLASVEAALERARPPARPAEPRAEPVETLETVPVPRKPRETPRRPAAAVSPVQDGARTADERPRPPAEPTRLGRGGREHIYLQDLIKREAAKNGWLVTVEKQVLDGLGQVDVALEKDGLSVACEISVTTTPEHELGNVHKCLAAGFNHVVVVSAEDKTLARARKFMTSTLTEQSLERVHFFTAPELFTFLEERAGQAASMEPTVGGRKVKVRYRAVSEDEAKVKKQAVAQVILSAVRRLRGKSE